MIGQWGWGQTKINLKISPEDPNSIHCRMLEGWSTLKHLVGPLAHDECSGTVYVESMNLRLCKPETNDLHFRDFLIQRAGGKKKLTDRP